MNSDASLIETDAFPFEFLSRIGERESWRKEIHRPIYHVHKWWAKRLGSVFRGILLGCVLPEDADLEWEFYRVHSRVGATVLDPFMGSGTTIGEAHKLGFTALGQDINPVALNAARVSFGPLDEFTLEKAFRDLSNSVGPLIRSLYHSKDSRGAPCDVLYYFWVMQAPCPICSRMVDLFPSWIIARNAYPGRKPVVQVLCPTCGDIFPSLSTHTTASCRSCGTSVNLTSGVANGKKAECPSCRCNFVILDVIGRNRPGYRLYGKLVLTGTGEKEYLPATDNDRSAYENCCRLLAEKVRRGEISLPSLHLEHGHNTRQAMSYGFLSWADFFNGRQLLALGILHRAILDLPETAARNALLTLFSGVLEFNNLFASYKGEGTGAVRHMFSHHILKPERTPIEANIWGTRKSSGSFSNLFRTRLLRAIAYRQAPAEIDDTRSAKRRVCSPPFSGEIRNWPSQPPFLDRAIYLSCGDSSQIALPDGSIDFVVTDPPFFDNVHYSELADFFYAWQQLEHGRAPETTRHGAEVQDADARRFSLKLQAIFNECNRVMRDRGLLIFTYHHSRDEGWDALIDAILGAGFVAVNAHPTKSEMSVATPKSQAKEPIQLDIIIVCRKAKSEQGCAPTLKAAVASAREKLQRLHEAHTLSRNDEKIVLYGQLLTTVRTPADKSALARLVDQELANLGQIGYMPAAREDASSPNNQVGLPIARQLAF